MIYGEGSKGNYPLLAKLAKKSPIFPNYPNKRSMLYIGNLCRFISLGIKHNDVGKFHPQNAEYVQTSKMVGLIAAHYTHKIFMPKAFNFIQKQPAVRIPELMAASDIAFLSLTDNPLFELPIPQKAALDGEYVEKMSLWFDLKCFVGTITSVLRGHDVVEGGTGVKGKQDNKKAEEL